MTTTTPTFCLEVLLSTGPKQVTADWLPNLSWEEANRRYDDACQEFPVPYTVILHREGGAPVYRREADGTTFMNSVEAGNAPAYTPGDEQEEAAPAGRASSPDEADFRAPYTVKAIPPAPSIGAVTTVYAEAPYDRAAETFSRACVQFDFPGYVVTMVDRDGKTVTTRNADGTTYLDPGLLDPTGCGGGPAPESALADRLGEMDAAAKEAALAFRKAMYVAVDALQVYGDAIQAVKTLAHDALQAAALTGAALEARDALTALLAVEGATEREGKALAVSQMLSAATYLA